MLVHGGWGDHNSWGFVVDEFARSYQVVAYDRRGHSQSDRVTAPDVFRAHEEDLGALIEKLGIAPAHVVGNSIGGSIALRLGGRRPEAFRSMCAHEPPSLHVLSGDRETEALAEDQVTKLAVVEQRLASGDMEGGARVFFETIALGPGAWEQLPEQTRRTYVTNAPTFLAEMRDPAQVRLDLEGLARFPHPTLLTNGDNSRPEFCGRGRKPCPRDAESGAQDGRRSWARPSRNAPCGLRADHARIPLAPPLSAAPSPDAEQPESS